MVREIGICYYNERDCLLSHFVARWWEIALMGAQIDDAVVVRENKTERRGEMEAWVKLDLSNKIPAIARCTVIRISYRKKTRHFFFTTDFKGLGEKPWHVRLQRWTSHLYHVNLQCSCWQPSVSLRFFQHFPGTAAVRNKDTWDLTTAKASQQRKKKNLVRHLYFCPEACW